MPKRRAVGRPSPPTHCPKTYALLRLVASEIADSRSVYDLRKEQSYKVKAEVLMRHGCRNRWYWKGLTGSQRFLLNYLLPRANVGGIVRAGGMFGPTGVTHS